MVSAAKTPAQRLTELRMEIHKHNRLYHALAEPVITDWQFDVLVNELKGLEAEYPELRERMLVGAKPESDNPKVTHELPMGSLDNTFNEAGFNHWYDTLVSEVGDVDLYAEMKYDGLAVSLTYEDGWLKQAVTRGNGFIGEDVTDNVRAIPAIPQSINDLGRLVVRGEVYASNEDFEIANRQQQKLGRASFATPRNYAAGTLMLSDATEVAKRPVSFYAYTAIRRGHRLADTQDELLALLESLGFRVAPERTVLKSRESAVAYWQEAERVRAGLGYPTDGVVFKVNDVQSQRSLGDEGGTPEWALAWKFPSEQVTATMLEVVYSVGMNGALNARASFTPCVIGGVTIRSAQLGSHKNIEEMDLRIGDTLLVERAGDVIPQIVRVVPDARTGEEQVIPELQNCPSCEYPLVREGHYIAQYCFNEQCPEQAEMRLRQWASSMEMMGVGPSVIQQLIDVGLLTDVSSFYLLKGRKAELLRLPGMGRVAVANLLKAIEGSKRMPFETVIASLCIEGIGPASAGSIAGAITTVDKLLDAEMSDLRSAGLGPSSAQTVHRWLSKEPNRLLLRRLKALGLRMEAVIEEVTEESVLSGKRVAVTGRLGLHTRREIETKIKQLGGIVTGGASSADYLIAGDRAGSKLRKARAAGVAVLTEQEFIALISKENVDE